MAIPQRQFDPTLVFVAKAILQNKLPMQDIVALILLSALDMYGGNRTRAAKELKIPLRTFREHLHVVAGLGYPVPKPQLGGKRRD